MEVIIKNNITDSEIVEYLKTADSITIYGRTFLTQTAVEKVFAIHRKEFSDKLKKYIEYKIGDRSPQTEYMRGRTHALEGMLIIIDDFIREG